MTESLKDLLNQALEKRIEYNSYEAVAKEDAVIRLPSFHYISFKLKDKDDVDYIINYCIDFDIFSTSTNETKAFLNLCEAVKKFIFFLIKKNDIDALYNNCNWDFKTNSLSELYFEDIKHKRIIALKNSLIEYSYRKENIEHYSEENKNKSKEEKIKELEAIINEITNENTTLKLFLMMLDELQYKNRETGIKFA